MSAPPKPELPRPLRLAQTIRLRPEHADEYIALHRAVWPAVLARISACNIRDYSIFYDRETGVLTATTTKYVGDDHEGDMRRMAEDAETRRWWEVTDGMQQSLNEGNGARSSVEGGAEGWWRRLEEVFRVE